MADIYTDEKNLDNSIQLVERAQRENELNRMIRTFEGKIESGKILDAYLKSSRKEMIKKMRKQLKVKASLTFVAGVLVGSLGLAGITGFYDSIKYNLKAQNADDELRKKASLVLLDLGLATKDDKGSITVKDNNISDYRCLDLTNASVLEQHIYCEVLGPEFDDAIQTASYANGCYNYIGTDQWRSINGFINKDSKRPSFSEQRAAMIDDLVNVYDNDFDGVIRSAEELVNVFSKGKK